MFKVLVAVSAFALSVPAHAQIWPGTGGHASTSDEVCVEVPNIKLDAYDLSTWSQWMKAVLALVDPRYCGSDASK